MRCHHFSLYFITHLVKTGKTLLLMAIAENLYRANTAVMYQDARWVVVYILTCLCVILKDQAHSRKQIRCWGFFEQRTRSKSSGFHPVRDADS